MAYLKLTPLIGRLDASNQLHVILHGYTISLLTEYSDRPFSHSHTNRIQRRFDNFWEALFENKTYYIAPGCKLTGLQIGHLKGGHLTISWKTLFDPGPRYSISEANPIPLGFHSNYDLYAVLSPEPAVMARCSDSDVIVWQQHLPLLHDSQKDGMALIEAERRAQNVNAFAATEFAKNNGLGSLALPSE